jgi:hypothetical protein
VGCAFEELISFHGGIGGPQTRPFILAPKTLPPPKEPIIGAAKVHEVLTAWRRLLNGDSRSAQDSAEPVGAAPSTAG